MSEQKPDRITILMDFATQDPEVPEHGPDKCPDCRVAVGTGYGLWGGGLGAYTYCPQCGTLLSKVQDHGE